MYFQSWEYMVIGKLKNFHPMNFLSNLEIEGAMNACETKNCFFKS